MKGKSGETSMLEAVVASDRPLDLAPAHIFTVGYNGRNEEGTFKTWWQTFWDAAVANDRTVMKDREPPEFEDIFAAGWRTISFGEVIRDCMTDKGQSRYLISASAWKGRSGGLVGDLRSGNFGGMGKCDL